jgi:type I restriction enzyme S subunit
MISSSLSEVLQTVLDYRGKTPKKLGGDWTSEGYRALSALNVKSHGLVKTDSIRYVNESIYKLWMKEEVQKGDILLTSEAPAGEVMIWNSDEKIVLSQRLFGLRVNEDVISNLYLKYYLQSSTGQNEIQNNTSGSTVFGISAKMFDQITIRYPRIQTQQKIANILSTLDAKIELNNKINAELEAMAKLVYDYWFVQFDFPASAADAASAGKPALEGKPYKSSGGKMEYNEELKREIPEGWEVKSLGDYAAIKKGTLITGKTANTNGDIKVVSAGISFSYYHSESNYEEDIITVSASGANAGFVNFWREQIFACDCTTVRGANLADTLQILGFLRLRQAYIYKQARGSAQPHVYPKDIEALQIAAPPEKIINAYGKLVVPGNQKISNNLKQNRELMSLRDWLLPMLMNGQVTVGEAEAKVKEYE